MRLALVAALAGGLALAPASPGATESDPSPSALSLFDARAVGSVVSFSFHVPEAFFPFQITGGILESTSRATSSPRGFGTAGLMPVPLATSIGLVIPRVIPGTDIPVPDDVQEAFKSIDFTALPNGCQASFPPVKDADQEAICGGPYQRDAALGFTAAGLNGHVHASGAFEEPFATRTVSNSRGADVTVPGLQATFHQAYSQSVTGLGEAGLPQGRAVAEIDSLSILGELLHIEGIRSETTVATDGTPDGARVTSTFTIRAASVFGIPVTIGPDGVAVNREAVPSTEVRTLSARIHDAMAQAGGMRVRLVPAPPVEVRGGEVTAQSGAIEISYLGQEPTPVDVVQRIAYSRATVNAVPGLAGSDVGGETSPGVGLGPADGGAPTGTGGEEPAFGVSAPVLSGPAATTAPSLGSAYRIEGPEVVPAPAVPEVGAAVPEPSGVVSDYRPGPSSTGRVRQGQAALAAQASGFSPTARARLKALYGGVAGVALLGLVLLPLLRTLVRTSPQPPIE
jgi:hypothetical protein